MAIIQAQISFCTQKVKNATCRHTFYRLLVGLIIFSFIFFVSFVSMQDFAFAEKNMTSEDIHELEEKANSGDAEAQFRLGVRHFEGDEVKQDNKKAKHYLELAAEQGHTDAQIKCGYIYELEKDHKKSLYYYVQSAKQGNARAQWILGGVYTSGRILGVKKDYQKALHYYKLAAKQDDTHSQYELGNMYFMAKELSKITKKLYIIMS